MHSKAIQDAKTVYNWMCDDESKSIFINRLSWLICGSEEYLNAFKRKEGGKAYPQVCGENAENLVRKVRQIGNPVILYGAGGIGNMVFDILHEAGICIKCFWDKDEQKQKSGTCNILTQTPGTDYKGEAVVVATGWYTDEVVANLQLLGVTADNIIIPEFSQIFEDINNSYFEKNIINFCDNEVFVDGGCLDFETCQILLDKCKTVKSIYAFEPDSNQWQSVQDAIEKSGFKNAHFIKNGLWSETTELNFTQTFGGGSSISEAGGVTIPVTSIDEAIQESVTFIKMDIEGSELEALKGAKRHIVEDRPKLAICVYHKPEDIFEIPMYIKSLVPEYRLFMRHYSSAQCATILYAVV